MEPGASLAQAWVKADRPRDVVVEVAHRALPYAAVAVGIVCSLVLAVRARPGGRA